MAMKPVVLSHWHQLLGDVDASPMEFYAAVEVAVERREVPDTDRTRVEHPEDGVGSAKREYLRIRRGRHVFDICGVPFGSGFFVSWWFGELRSGPAKLAVIVFGVLVLLAIVTAVGGWFLGFLFVIFGMPGIFVLLALRAPGVLAGWDDPVRSIPFLGPLYESWFRPETYSVVDTYRMFQSAVHGAVLEAVDELREDNGLRTLNELERKPMHREVQGLQDVPGSSGGEG